MPLDASIYRQNPLKSVMDYENEYAQADLAKQTQQMNRLQLLGAQQKQDEYTRGLREQEQLRNVLAGVGSAPVEQRTQALRATGLPSAYTMAASMEEQAIKAREGNAKAAKDEFEIVKGKAALIDGKIAQHQALLKNVTTPDQAQYWLAAAYQDPDLAPIMSRLGPLEQAAQSIPRDPQGFSNWLLQSQSGADKLRAQIATELRDAETKANNLRTDERVKSEGAANRGVQIRGQNLTDARAKDANARAAEANSIASAANVIKTETEVRKEFNDLPEVKNYKAAVPSYKAVKDAAGRNTPQSDINLIYGIAKLYDPTSVVREGEYATIANSQAIPEWLKGQAQRLAGGGKLSAETKRQLLTEAEGRINSYQAEYDKAKSTYEGVVKGRGGDPAKVFTPVGGSAPVAPAGWSIKPVP